MTCYPFINASFPDIAIGVKLEFSFQGLRDLLSLNLSENDQKKVTYLLRSIDLDNIRALWLGTALNEQGNFTGKELEEALLVRDSLPRYLIEFLERYDSTEERLAHFSSLYASLYRETAGKVKGFLRDYYQFEREVRLVLTALRAKKEGRNIVRELQFDDPHDPFVMQILAQKDAPDYLPPSEYEGLKGLYLEKSADPLEAHRAFLQYRFEKILELEENYQDFTIDRILGFVARFMIVEMWDRLDREKGAQLVDDLSKDK